jgi:hypothetical protein
MERIGLEPVTFGLQTRSIIQPRLTTIDRIGIAEPK